MSTSDSHPDLVSKPLDERALAQIERSLDFGHGPSWALLAECRRLREEVETHKRERDLEVSSYVEENQRLRAERDEVRKHIAVVKAARKAFRDAGELQHAEWGDCGACRTERTATEAYEAALDRLLGGAE